MPCCSWFGSHWFRESTTDATGFWKRCASTHQTNCMLVVPSCPRRGIAMRPSTRLWCSASILLRRQSCCPYSSTAHTVRDFEIFDDAHDNVQVALRWMLEARRATEGLVLIRALVPLWLWRAVPADGRQWLEAMLELADRESDSVPPALRALTLFFGGVIARLQGDVGRARELLETSVALWRTIDDQVGLAIALCGLGNTKACTREFEQAESALTESLELARGSGSYLRGLSRAEWTSALSLALQGQSERATTFLRESLALGRTLERAADRGHRGRSRPRPSWPRLIGAGPR